MDDDQRNLLLNWTYLCQEKSMDEARQSLLLTMELEEARLKAEDELKLRDAQIIHLRELLSRTVKERDEAQEKCQKMLLEKILVQQQLQHYQQSTPHSGISSIEDDHRRGIDSNNGFSSSDCDESIVSSPLRMPPPPPPAVEAEPDFPVTVNRPLPEKGKLLEAVMKAGPLLHTLLLAGPLPQWRHPPPPVDAFQIPPPPVVVPPSSLPTVSTQFLHQDSLQSNVSINNCGRIIITRKRGLSECSDSTNEFKYQRVALQ